eukprot:jgi/Galph1/4894/GphlegSOOS_G3584.1
MIRKPQRSKVFGDTACIADPDGYWIELFSRDAAEKNLSQFGKDVSLLGRDPVLAQTMLRVKDPVKSRAFYENELGMKYLLQLDVADEKYSLYFYGYTDESIIPQGNEATKQSLQWLLKQRFPRMALKHHWGTESDPNFAYNNGNTEPRGFGHIGLTVDDIYEACEKLEKNGYKIVRKPGPFQDVGEIAFVADPDG